MRRALIVSALLCLLVPGERPGPDPRPATKQPEPAPHEDACIIFEGPSPTEEQLLKAQAEREAGQKFATATMLRKAAENARANGDTEFAAELRGQCIDLLQEVID